MGRKRGGSHKPDDPILDGEVSLPAIRSHTSSNRDPREPIGVGIAGEELTEQKPITGQAVRMDGALDARELQLKFARNLVAFRGDKLPALAATFDCTIEEATRDMLMLSRRITGAAKAIPSTAEVIEDHDLGVNVRVAKLREHLHSPKEAVSMKAIDMINDMDATLRSKKQGTSWEHFAQGAREKAKQQLADKGKKHISEV